MPNPLRVPIVLLVILGGMLAYVHFSYRERHTTSAIELEDNELSLRKFGATPRTAALRNELPVDIGPTRPVSQANVADLLSAAITPVPIRGKDLSAAAGIERNQGEIATESRHVAVLPPIGRAEPRAGEMTRVESAGQQRGDSRTDASDVNDAEFARSDATLRRVRGPNVDPQLNRSQLAPAERRSVNRSHRITDGDTLRRLAARYLGSEDRYMEIFAANRDILVRPDLLPIGHTLRIPADGLSPNALGYGVSVRLRHAN